MALISNAELVIDDVSGFVRDFDYRRDYQLDHFSVPCRKATSRERLEPLSRARRHLKRFFNRNRPFEERSYIQQEGIDFDSRLLRVNPRGTLRIEGYWQSEGYFKDVEDTIRADLQFTPPTDAANLKMASRARGNQSVAVHVRWFDAPSDSPTHNMADGYYQRAIASMESKLNSPQYFIFSDRPEAVRLKLNLPTDRVTCVSHNKGDENAYADLWLMSQCRHFITANSTFSWWGAWLGEREGSVVITPDVTQKVIEKTNWGFDGLIPARWLVI